MDVDRSTPAQAWNSAAGAPPFGQGRDPLLTALDIDLRVLTSLTLVVGRVAAGLDPAAFQNALREEHERLTSCAHGMGREGEQRLLVGLLDEMIGECFENRE